MSKRKLLLADDSVTIQKVVNLTFADEGIEVISVGDGDTAMQRISDDAPDVVLADVHMPGLNGYEICERLRQDPNTRDLPVVLLVGSFEPFDEAEAERVGANAHLTKPFQSIRQLVTQVTGLISGTASPSSEQDVAEFIPASDGPDTSDIDVLYEQSFAESHEAGSGGDTEDPSAGYVYAGMDDEMIEEKHADELLKDTGSQQAGSSDEFVEDDGAYVPPVSASGASPSPFDSTVSDTAAATASALDPDFDHFTATERITDASQAATEESFSLDEVELLDLPPIDSGKTLEFTTTQRMVAEGGRKEVVSLSPELIEIIVQKVVERLSEKN